MYAGAAQITRSTSQMRRAISDESASAPSRIDRSAPDSLGSTARSPITRSRSIAG
jgi:hypothetical protein